MLGFESNNPSKDMEELKEKNNNVLEVIEEKI